MKVVMSKNNDSIIIIDNDSDGDIDELRELAIISMVKQDEISVIENFNSTPLEYQILSSRKRTSSEISNEESKRPKLGDSKTYNVESIIRESLSDLFNVNDIIHFDKVDFAKNLLKEEELKLKLLRVLDNKVKLNENKHVANETVIDPPLSESDENDDFHIFTHALLPKEIITDVNVLKYHNLIARVKTNLEEINKSIKAMSSSIQANLNKSKKITMQMENLKNQKIQIHKDISINRRRILDFNKIRKQKSLELVKYEKLKKHFYLHQRRPPVSTNTDNAETMLDSLSTISGDTVDSRTSTYEVDCNHIICPFWLQTNCVNKTCVYQHPKFISKPIVRKALKIKENDKVFLKEMNPAGFISKLSCDACSETIFMPTLHLTDDWHCKSCCQQLIGLKSANDMLSQLVSIWHHIYKRFVMSKTVSAENRDPSIRQHLYKCTEAIAAKLRHSLTDISAAQLRIAGHHIILTFDEESRVDELIAFVKLWNYHPDFVLFASRLSFPVGKLLQLVIDSIGYHIRNGKSWPNPDLLVDKFCFLSKSVDSTIIGTLIEWLELSIAGADSDDSLIGILIKAIFAQILGPPFVPGLTLSLNDLRLGDIYWADRKETLTKLMQLYVRRRFSSATGGGGRLDLLDIGDDPMHLLLMKYLIVCQFFTGNEDSALELCERYSSRHFVFEILLSKLSLEYNSPLVVDDKSRLIEHIYNKSQWLLTNRSVGSCVKLLETVPHILYRNISPIDSLNVYRHFLQIGLKFDGNVLNPVANMSDGEMKSIRETSSIWLCYIYLLISIDNNINDDDNNNKLLELIKSDRLLSLPTNHVTRIVHSILTLLANRSVGERYLQQLRSVFLFVEKSIDFVDFYELFICVNFDNLLEVQLQGWLFLVDFCVVRFNDECVDHFLVAVSRKLSENRDYANSCEVFHHIVMCYPIRVEEVWLNFIELLLSCNSPLYELIDVCEMATASFRSSKSLWRHYGFCAAKTGDQDLMKTIRTNAAKFGFDLF